MISPGSTRQRPEYRARDLVYALAHEEFDLTSPPLMRAALADMPGGRSLLVFVLHHIVGDGWSMMIVYEEVLELYAAARSGRSARLKPLPLQYKDIAVMAERPRLSAGGRILDAPVHNAPAELAAAL